MKYVIKKFGRVGTIEPIPNGVLSETLTRKFSYFKQGSEFLPNPRWGLVQLYKEKTGRFPWGLLNGIVKIIKKYSEENEVIVQGLNIPELNYDRLKSLDPKLRYYQKDSILKLILNGGGVLSLPTGAGKSFTFLEYAKYMDMKTLIIVPTLDLVRQWKSQILSNMEVTNHHQLIKNKERLKKFEIVAYDECMSYETIVLTNMGYKEIGNISNSWGKYKGIKAMSYNMETADFEWKNILRTYKNKKEELLRVNINDKVIKCTENHKILTNKGYKRVDELKIGDTLLKYKYLLDKIESLEINKIKNTKLYVYNLNIEDTHNYVIFENWKKNGERDEGFIVSNCHMTPAKTVYDVMMNTGQAINIGLTATPYREDFEDLKIFAACGPIVHQIDRKKLIKEGYLADAEIKYIKLKDHCKSRFTPYMEIYDMMIVNNLERNDKIIKIVENNPNKRILILISRIEHGEILSDLLDHKNINHIFIHGEIKDRTIRDKDRIVIATSIADQGLNLPTFNLLILGVGGQSGVKLTQRIGRVLRPKPDGRKSIVYDFMDKSKYLINHYKKRRKILTEEFNIEEIDIK